MIKKRKIKFLYLLPLLAAAIVLPSFNSSASFAPALEPVLIHFEPQLKSNSSYHPVNYAVIQDSTLTPTAPIIIANLQTAAPADDGSVTHIVADGQTLWSIAVAYGVMISEIRNLNGMAADNNVIIAGQSLLIYPAGSLEVATPTTEEIEIDLTGTAVMENQMVATTVTPLPTFTASPAGFVIPETAEERLSQPGSLVFPLIGMLLIVAGFGLRSMVKRQRF